MFPDLENRLIAFGIRRESSGSSRHIDAVADCRRRGVTKTQGGSNALGRTDVEDDANLGWKDASGRTLIFQVQNLRRTGDLLLPQLISGQGEVSS